MELRSLLEAEYSGHTIVALEFLNYFDFGNYYDGTKIRMGQYVRQLNQNFPNLVHLKFSTTKGYGTNIMMSLRLN